ncbi:MAG TPA: hypothetical protein VK623_00150 [Flavobacterium sp.]|nr:hypothetical protein [Flavobacterium sp.]
MEEEKSFTQKIYEQVEDYAKTTVGLYKLRAINTFADLFAAVSAGFILWVIFSLFLLFVSIGAAFYLGDLLGKWHYGFFIVAGFYILVGVIVYIFRVKCLKEKINNFIIKQIFKD